jgi:predicted O-methyltransferase YrrM
MFGFHEANWGERSYTPACDPCNTVTRDTFQVAHKWSIMYNGASSPHREAVMFGTKPISTLLQGQIKEPVLIDRDNPANGNVAPYELEVIASLVCATAPRVIFEIGTFDGRTALNMAVNSPDGATVYTLDLPATGLGSTAFLLELNEDMFVRKERSGSRFADSGYHHNIVQLYGDSATFDFAAYYGRVDFMFIDGSHAYEYVKSDTLAALKMVRAGGTIVWHDYVREGPTPFPGVPRALKEFFLTDSRFEMLTQIANTSIVHLRVPEQQFHGDFRPRMQGDSSRPEHLAGELLVSTYAETTLNRSIPVKIVARNTGSAVWLPSDESVGPVRVGVRVLDIAGHMIDPDYYRVSLPFRRAVFPGETVEFVDVVPKAGREPCILEFDLVADGVAWFNLPERPIINIGDPPQAGSRSLDTFLRFLRRYLGHLNSQG